jgi:peptide/nickel transport system substrate-binding protein
LKTSVFRYIFFIIVIVLVGISIYVLYKDSKKTPIEIKNSKTELNIEGEINIGITSFDSINPLLSNNRDIQYIGKLIFQSLLDISYDFKIENLLAKEFSKINPTTYIVKLKDDVYWHDGTNFTAQDVIFTINNLKNDNINSIYKENVSKIGKVEQIDEYTIKIFLTEEVPFFEYKMCFPILASHSYEDGTLNSKSSIPVGTGKYKIDSIEEKSISLISNENEKTKLRKINIILKDTVKDLYNALTKEELDYMVTDNIEYADYIGTMGYNVKQAYNREYEYLALNNENKILSDKKIRKVINCAIDKKAINYNVYNNKHMISNFPLDYGCYLYSQEEKATYDINKAKKILRENGWKYVKNYWVKNNNKLEFKLIVNENKEKRVLLAEEIKRQLQEIGIIINIVKVNDNIYNNYIKNKKYDIILAGNIVSNSPDLRSYFGENNLSNFKEEEISMLLKDISNINDEKIMESKYSRLTEIYKEEEPFISLYFNSLFVLTRTNLKGDLSFNWYNLFYNIDNWYKIK